jgi:hypothetical protein
VAWLHLLLDEHGGGEFHTLAAFLDAGAEKQRAQVLFDGARADVQVARDFLVTAALDEQTKHLLVTGRYLDFVEIDHGRFVCSFGSVLGLRPTVGQCKQFAKSSLWGEPFRIIELAAAILLSFALYGTAFMKGF